MAGPTINVTLWDGERPAAELLDACGRALRAAGARVDTIIGTGAPTLHLSEYPPFGATDEEVPIRVHRRDGTGGLVEIAVPLDYLDVQPGYHRPAAVAAEQRAQRWAEFRDALIGLLAAVRAALAVWPVELSADELPDPPEEAADLLFRNGWVDPARLEESKRAAFRSALEGTPVTEVAGGWWWAGDADLDLAGQGSANPAGLSAGVWSAWTGRPVAAAVVAAPERAERPGPRELPELPPIPELWFWAADRDDAGLLAEVQAWAAAAGVPVDRVALGLQGEPGWFPVVVRLAGPALSADDLDAVLRGGLRLLRAAVGAVRPSWAALLPDSGLAVPGLDPAVPSTGVLGNVWVDRAWVGADLGRLLGVLDGAHREDVAGGVLLVTSGQALEVDDRAPWCRDDDQWWDRMVDAARVLGEAARASRTSD